MWCMESKNRMKTCQCIQMSILLSNASTVLGQELYLYTTLPRESLRFPNKTSNSAWLSHSWEKDLAISESFALVRCLWIYREVQVSSYLNDNAYALKDGTKVMHKRSDTKPIWSSHMHHDIQNDSVSPAQQDQARCMCDADGLQNSQNGLAVLSSAPDSELIWTGY